MIELYYTYDSQTLVVNQQGISTTRFSLIPEYPKNALLSTPLPPKEGYVVLVCEFENGRPNGTKYVPDFRGKVIYKTINPSETKEVRNIGELEIGWTLKIPSTPFDEWISGNWLTNQSNKHIAEYNQVDDKRRALYSQMCDPLKMEAMDLMDEGKEVEALQLKQQALAAKQKIKAENPWPVAPEA